MLVYSLTSEEFVASKNSAKDQVLAQLLKDGVITQECCEKYTYKYGFCAVTKSVYKRIYEKFFKNDELGSIRFAFVQIMSDDATEEDYK